MGTECATGFEHQKMALCSSPVFKSPEFDEPFILQTDASDMDLGAVLSQVTAEGDDRPIAYIL